MGFLCGISRSMILSYFWPTQHCYILASILMAFPWIPFTSFLLSLLSPSLTMCIVTGPCISQNGALIICKNISANQINIAQGQMRAAYLCTHRKRGSYWPINLMWKRGIFFQQWNDLDCKASNHSTTLPTTTTTSNTLMCPQSPLQRAQVCNFSVSTVMYLAFYFTLIGEKLATYSFTAPWHH